MKQLEYRPVYESVVREFRYHDADVIVARMAVAPEDDSKRAK